MDKMKEFPRYSTLFIAVVLGALVGVGVYRASQMGLIKLPKGNSLPLNTITRSITSEENAITDVAEKASPSVVAIGVTQRLINPFDPFAAPSNQNSTIGTGFVVSDKGVIVTNKHVVADPNGRYTVVGKDNKQYEVQKIYRDPVLDLALVQVNGNDLQALPLGDSSKIKIGQTAIAIGNALGRFTNTVTSGIVSGLGRKVIAGDPYSGSSESLDNLIQSDAAINPGNSGGPLLNSSGEVIGVNVATTEGAQNIGFAIPINPVKKIVDEFVTRGTVSRPFLGIRYSFLTKEAAASRQMVSGAFIQEVIAGASADKAGIQPGDIITKIDGKQIEDDTTISQTIASKKTGDKLNLVVWNNGKERNVTATLQDLPQQ